MKKILLTVISIFVLSKFSLPASSYVGPHELYLNLGTINFYTPYSQDASYGFLMNSPDSHFLSLFPSLAKSDYNPLTQAGDTGIIFSKATGLVIAPWTNTFDGIRITPSGNVGIGLTSPQTSLEVNGDIEANNNFLVSGNVYITGSISDSTSFLIPPTGAVMPFAGSSAPSGWLICDGSAVSRSTYSDLYAVITTLYGSGNGSTTFNLPNLSGKIPIGLDSSDSNMNTIGETGGRKTVSGTDLPSHYHSIPSHTHSYQDIYYSENGGDDLAGLGINHIGSGDTDGDNEDYQVQKTTSSSGAGNTGTSTSGASNSTMNIMNPYFIMKYIIKY